MCKRTDYRLELVIAIVVGIVVLICIFFAGCTGRMTPGELQAYQSYRSFDQEMRLLRLEQQQRTMRLQRASQGLLP